MNVSQVSTHTEFLENSHIDKSVTNHTIVERCTAFNANKVNSSTSS